MKGADQHPLYAFITDAKRGKKIAGDPKWNFQKFLADVDGNIVGRFDPAVDPLSKDVTSIVERELKRAKKSKKTAN